MSNEYVRTSEITERLRHRSPAVTRAWISSLPKTLKLEVADRDNETGEKLWHRDQVERAIEATNRRGPYRKEPRSDHDGLPGSD